MVKSTCLSGGRDTPNGRPLGSQRRTSHMSMTTTSIIKGLNKITNKDYMKRVTNQFIHNPNRKNQCL